MLEKERIKQIFSEIENHRLSEAKKSKQAEVAIELERLMSEYSERCYCAGWLIGTEHVLWKMILHQETEWGIDQVSLEELNYLLKLAELCDGWWIWDDSQHYQQFISLNEWKNLYENFQGELYY